jgi:hypothetical protein
MNIGFDLDGVIDSFPRQSQTIISAMAAAGHRVFVITGYGGTGAIPPDIVQGKRTYLASLGITTYSDLIVVPQPNAPNKAQAIVDNGIDVFIDNDKDNIKGATANGCMSLLLWNSKQ